MWRTKILRISIAARLAAYPTRCVSPLASRVRAGELRAPFLQAREQRIGLLERGRRIAPAQAHLAEAAEQEVVLDRHAAEQRARLGHERDAEHHTFLQRAKADRPTVVFQRAVR